MAFSFDGELGKNNVKSAGTTLQITVGQNVSAGDLVIVRCATDNGTTTDGATAPISVSDSQGNTYTRAAEETQTGGSFGDGVTAGIFYSIITAALTASTDTITLTSANVVSRAMVVEAYSGTSIAYYGSPTNGSGSGTSPSLTLTGNSGESCLYIPNLAGEYKPSNYTEDTTDFTAGSVEGPTAGGNESCVFTGGGYATDASGGNISHDPALAAACDYAHVGAVFYEDTGGTTYYQSAAGAETPTGAVTTRRPFSSKVLDGAETAAGIASTLRKAFKSLAGSVTDSGEVTTEKNPSGGTLYYQSASGSETPTGALDAGLLTESEPLPLRAKPRKLAVTAVGRALTLRVQVRKLNLNTRGER